MPTGHLLSIPQEIRNLILEEALSPSGRTVEIVINRHTNGNGKAWFSPKIPYNGLMSACRQLRSEALPFLQKGIILDIKNDTNYSVSIKKAVPKRSNRDLVTAMFYDLPKPDYAHGNRFRLLDSALTLPNLHTVGFKNSHIFGYHHDGLQDVYTYDQIRDHELEIQAEGRSPELILQWPELDYDRPEQSESDDEILVIDTLFRTRPDVCIMVQYTVTGQPGCLGACKSSYHPDPEWEEDSDGATNGGDEECDWDECDCNDQTEWEAIAIRESYKRTWRFVDDFYAREGGFDVEMEKQVFARVQALE